MSIFESTQSLIKQAIDINLEGRKRIEKEIIEPLAYLKEYCTIKISLGRQTGQTTAIFKMSNNYRSFIFVSYNESSLTNAVLLCRELTKDYDNILFYSRNQRWDSEAFHSRRNKIILDVASLYSHKEIEAIYRDILLMECKEPTILMIG
jgi:hypothetical protein